MARFLSPNYPALSIESVPITFVDGVADIDDSEQERIEKLRYLGRSYGVIEVTSDNALRAPDETWTGEMPADILFGTITARGILVGGDIPTDADNLPQVRPFYGGVTFRPSQPVQLTAASGAASIMYVMPVYAGWDAEGFLVNADGQRGVQLIATDSPGLSVQGWDWIATFDKVDGQNTVDPIPFQLPANQTIDLAHVAPHPASNGTLVSRGPEGPPGPGYTWRGDWVAGTPYAVRDIVRSNGSVFMVTVAHTAATAPTIEAPGAEYELWAAKGDVGPANAPLATETTEGIIRLAGDLSGTYDAPTVPRLNDLADIAHEHGIADAAPGAVNVVKFGAAGWTRPTIRGDVVIMFKKDAKSDPDPPVVVPPSLDGMYAPDPANGVYGDIIIQPLEEPAPVAGAPSAPTAVAATRTETSATITWEPPTSDGGSPINGYRVVQSGGTTNNHGATVRSSTFNGLVAESSYSFTVTASNVNGRSPGVSVTVDPVASTSVVSRFPGDPNPLETGQVIWGIDEYDKDPTTQHVSEVSRPETSAGMPAGSMRLFYNKSQGSTPIASASGAALADINTQHDAGRIPWVSISYGSWAVQDDGRNNAAWDYFINWVETTAKGPVWFTMIHEPENQTTGHPSLNGAAGDGTEADWYGVQKAFRARMNAYASANGGLATYKWKNLAFCPVLTAYAYWRGANTYGIDRYVTQQAANQNPKTDRIFDFMGCDYYVGGQAGTIGSPAWGANIVKTVDWCKLYGYTLGVAEWGVNRRDVDAATKMQEIWNRTFDGTNDIIAWLYYNSSVGSTDPTQQRWLLDNVDNGGLLNKWVALLQNAKSIHYWDMKSPGTGVNYTRPVGV